MTDANSETHVDAVRRATGQRRRYPSLNLEQAIARTRALYTAERSNPTPLDVVAKHWGFKNSKTGPASTAYSAVKQFGLIEESGTTSQRKAAVSRRGRAILTAPEDVRNDLLREAALEPPTNRLVWDQFGPHTGSPDSFKWHLISELGFSDSGASEFVKQYEATIRFAGLDAEPLEEPEIDTSADQETAPRDVPSAPSQVTSTSAPTPRSADLGRGSRHAIPLIGGKQVILEGEFPLSEAAWAGFMAVLEAFKPGLVESRAAQPAETPEARTS